MISKKLKDALEDKYTLYITKDNDGKYEVSVDTHTDYGEEFYETIYGKNDEELLDSAYELWQGFDIDEHFNLWWGANRGEPSTASQLLKACENYEKYCEELYKTIKEVIK